MKIVLKLGLILSILFGVFISIAGALVNEDIVIKAALDGNWEKVSIEAPKLDNIKIAPVQDILLGYACLHKSDWIRAWKHFSKLAKGIKKKDLLDWAENICKENPKSAMSYFFRGDVYARLGEYNKAIISLDRAIKIKPQHALAYNLRGLVRIFQLHYGNAADNLEKSLELKPQFLDTWLNRAILHILTGHYERAVDLLTNVLEVDSTFFLARNARGIAYTMLAKYDNALEDFDKVLKQVPSFRIAFINKELMLILRARGILVEELLETAYISPKGVLRGNISIIVGDKHLLDKGTGIVADGIYNKTGVRPRITNNITRAMELSNKGFPVILQNEAARGITVNLNPRDTDLYKTLKSLPGDRKVDAIGIGLGGMDNLAKIASKFEDNINSRTYVDPFAGTLLRGGPPGKAQVKSYVPLLKQPGTNVLISDSAIQKFPISILQKGGVSLTIARIDPETKGLGGGVGPFSSGVSFPATPSLLEKPFARRAFEKQLPNGTREAFSGTTGGLVGNLLYPQIKTKGGLPQLDQFRHQSPAGVRISLHDKHVQEHKGEKVDLSSLLDENKVNKEQVGGIPDNPQLCYPFLILNQQSQRQSSKN